MSITADSMTRIVEVRPYDAPDAPVEGGVYQNVRSIAWDNWGRGWSLEDCEEAGKSVAATLIDFWDNAGEDTLIMASHLAIQEPPLIGTKLIRFMTGAQTAVEQSKMMRIAKSHQRLSMQGIPIDHTGRMMI